MRAGRWRDARTLLETEPFHRDNSVASLQKLCLGECRVKCHDDAAALGAFRESLDLAPSAAAELGAARCLARLGRDAEAAGLRPRVPAPRRRDAGVVARFGVLTGRRVGGDDCFLARAAFAGRRDGAFLDRVRANAWCVHDPAYRALDDKVALHRRITERGDAALRATWPEARELPCAEEFDDDGGGGDAVTWVAKPRRGYGGGGVVFHGSWAEATSAGHGAHLAQRYVAPLLLRGRAASLRAYVVVRGGDAWLAADGVVRFAPRDYGDGLDGAVHATNAAQSLLDGADLAEEDFGWARDRVPGWESRAWPRVEAAAAGVARLARLAGSSPLVPGLPKILGLDFAVDGRGDAWLLEVNATPGLAPRAATDGRVKEAVVAAAWDLPPRSRDSLLRPLALPP
ncbi:tubulin tyrosine ligase-like protein [Aureococcus anophagefferens]|uniref:Tubulin tyrosine ligase-like protein n=1 Tax=Aureococcus anophagefferens TaxID=44056 RepID=A0ABR1G9W6_AURAN